MTTSTHLLPLPRWRAVCRPRPTGSGVGVLLSDGSTLCRSSLSQLEEALGHSSLPPRCDFWDPAATQNWRLAHGLPPVEVLVSACLAGECCRYDGNHNRNPGASALVEAGKGFPICPEVFGGLPCPRLPCERLGERVIDREGADHTAAFVAGASRAVKTAQILGAKAALLKARSPSCGIGRIYDGSFSRRLVTGEGLAAQALRQAGLQIFCEEDSPWT